MRETRVEVGTHGLSLAVCQWNTPSSGVPLVILHGLLEQGAAWDEVARQLSMPVHAPDHRGQGLSDHVGRGGFYHFWDYVADVERLLDGLGVEQVDLCGHSLGGTVACLFASCRPERVRRLVLVEGLGPPDMAGSELDRGRRFLTDRSRVLAHRPLDGLDDAVARMRRWSPRLSEDRARRLAARVTRPIRPGDTLAGEAAPGQLIWTWDPLHRARSPRPFLAASFAHHLDALQAPVWLLYGSETFYAWPDLPEREARLDIQERRVLDGCGHSPHLEAPGRVAAFLADALGS